MRISGGDPRRADPGLGITHLEKEWGQSRPNAMKIDLTPIFGMFAAFAAIYGLASTLFTLLSAATGKGSPTAILVWFVVVSVFLLGAKFYVDKRAFWYKFVVAHLDAISHGLSLKKLLRSD